MTINPFQFSYLATPWEKCPAESRIPARHQGCAKADADARSVGAGRECRRNARAPLIACA